MTEQSLYAQRNFGRSWLVLGRFCIGRSACRSRISQRKILRLTSGMQCILSTYCNATWGITQSKLCGLNRILQFCLTLMILQLLISNAKLRDKCRFILFAPNLLNQSLNASELRRYLPPRLFKLIFRNRICDVRQTFLCQCDASLIKRYKWDLYFASPRQSSFILVSKGVLTNISPISLIIITQVDITSFWGLEYGGDYTYGNGFCWGHLHIPIMLIRHYEMPILESISPCVG